MNGSIRANVNVKEATISAKVLRADGRVEDLGMISYYNKNPFKDWLGRLMIKIARITRGGQV